MISVMEAKFTEPVSLFVIVLKVGADSILGSTASAQRVSRVLNVAAVVQIQLAIRYHLGRKWQHLGQQ